MKRFEALRIREFEIKKVDFAAGDVIRVAPAVKRPFSAAADSPVSWACIQVRENSLEEYTAGDASIG